MNLYEKSTSKPRYRIPLPIPCRRAQIPLPASRTNCGQVSDIQHILDPGRCLSGAEKGFPPCWQGDRRRDHQGSGSYRPAAGVTTYRRARITFECDMPSAEKIVELPLPAEAVHEPDVVARFEIRYSRFLDPKGNALRPLPDFAAGPAELVALYRGMVLARAFDAKAVALQRTGRPGTFPSALGREAVAVGFAGAMRKEDVFLPS